MLAWLQDNYLTLSGVLIAGLCAAVVVGIDCYVSAEKLLNRVPLNILHLPAVWVLCLVCGAAAGVAFWTTDGTGQTWVDVALGLKQDNPLLRAVLVGSGVLVLIRSRVVTIRETDVGGEFVYSRMRAIVHRRLTRRWSRYKSTFWNNNSPCILAEPGYEERLVEQITELTRTESEEFRTIVNRQIQAVQGRRPSQPFDAASHDWRMYYRGLTGVALDACGTAVFDGWIRVSG